MQTKGLSITKKNFWDRNAARYDRFMRKNAIAYDQLYALLRPAVWHKAVLEVATGTGQVAKHLLCTADHIEATDASAAMIAQAKRGNFSSKLYFSVQDMFHLPYADQSFDVVIVSNALHIVPHPEKALIEFRRVLKNDGTLIAPTFTHAENSPWVKDSGPCTENYRLSAAQQMDECCVSGIFAAKRLDRLQKCCFAEFHSTYLRRV